MRPRRRARTAEGAPKYKNILLTVDLNEESSWVKAPPTAVALGGALGTRLYVITIVPNLGMTMVGQFFPEDFEKNVVEETEKQLAAFVG